MPNTPKRLTSEAVTRWRRKDTWTLCETAFLLCGYEPPVDMRAEKQTPQEVRKVAENMGRARIAGHLRTIGPEDDNRRKYMLRQHDVFAWAACAYPEFPLALRIGEPNEPEPPARAVPVAQQHESTVLAAIRAAGHDPLAQPPRRAGTSTAKAEARQKCSLSRAQFDHAWKALRAVGEIKERD